MAKARNTTGYVRDWRTPAKTGMRLPGDGSYVEARHDANAKARQTAAKISRMSVKRKDFKPFLAK